MDSYHIIVIGAGPAGMMAAFRAAQLTDRVALFEKNATPARKLGLTGKGRCNITNTASLDEFIKKFGKNGLFLRHVFHQFFTQDLIHFFETHGLKIKVERQGRVFPESDKASSVIDVFAKVLNETHVALHVSAPVKRIKTNDQGLLHIVLSDGKEFLAKRVIIATGALSYPETGSTGDGFLMARQLGHLVEDVYPGLVPLETEENFVKDLQGLTLKNVTITFLAEKKKIVSPVGEILFTHFGISGPLVLDMSAEVCWLLKTIGPVKAVMDLKTGLSREALDEKLRLEFQSSGTMMIKNYLDELLPQRLIDVVLKIVGVDGKKKCHQVTLAERKKIVDAFKSLPLTIKKPRPLSEAMVTCGGVSLKEVNPKTLESRKCPGIYFCGEVLDVAAASGGFNLQAAFSTGYAAGEAAALSLKK